MLSPPRPADHVGQTVAGAGHRRCALQRQVLDVVRQRIVDGRPHKVDALAGLLDHEVASVVDVVEVVAGAARHAVLAQTAVEHVVARAPVQGVVADLAEELVVSGVAVESIGSLAALQGIRSATAEQAVVAGPATQDVGETVAPQRVVARAASGIFDQHAVGDGEPAEHAVDP